MTKPSNAGARECLSSSAFRSLRDKDAPQAKLKSPERGKQVKQIQPKYEHDECYCRVEGDRKERGESESFSNSADEAAEEKETDKRLIWTSSLHRRQVACRLVPRCHPRSRAHDVHRRCRAAHRRFVLLRALAVRSWVYEMVEVVAPFVPSSHVVESSPKGNGWWARQECPRGPLR